VIFGVVAAEESRTRGRANDVGPVAGRHGGSGGGGDRTSCGGQWECDHVRLHEHNSEKDGVRRKKGILDETMLFLPRFRGDRVRVLGIFVVANF